MQAPPKKSYLRRLVFVWVEPHGPLLAASECVWTTEEDLRWKVLAQFATERALDGDGLKRKFIPTGGHIATASLAGDHEGLAA
jgi:hypothetical protein